MKTKILSPILDITGAPLRNIMWYTTFFLHIALIPIFLGIWTTVPSYVQIFSNWIHLVAGLYLVIRFRPYQTEVKFHSHDRALVFSAGLFMLEALLASVLLSTPLEKDIQNYAYTWRDWARSLPFIAPFVANSATTDGSNTANKTKASPAPHPPTSSLGSSSALGASEYSSTTEIKA